MLQVHIQVQGSQMVIRPPSCSHSPIWVIRPSLPAHSTLRSKVQQIWRHGTWWG